MQTIDEIRIEGDEDGWHLIVLTDDDFLTEYRIGLPDQFKNEVDRTIGAWLAEGELVKAVMRASSDGYDKDDPKHPMWLEQIHARVDMDAVEDLERIAREGSD